MLDKIIFERFILEKSSLLLRKLGITNIPDSLARIIPKENLKRLKPNRTKQNVLKPYRIILVQKDILINIETPDIFFFYLYLY